MRLYFAGLLALCASCSPSRVEKLDVWRDTQLLSDGRTVVATADLRRNRGEPSGQSSDLGFGEGVRWTPIERTSLLLRIDARTGRTEEILRREYDPTTDHNRMGLQLDQASLGFALVGVRVPGTVEWRLVDLASKSSELFDHEGEATALGLRAWEIYDGLDDSGRVPIRASRVGAKRGGSGVWIREPGGKWRMLVEFGRWLYSASGAVVVFDDEAGAEVAFDAATGAKLGKVPPPERKLSAEVRTTRDRKALELHASGKSTIDVDLGRF